MSSSKGIFIKTFSPICLLIFFLYHPSFSESAQSPTNEENTLILLTDIIQRHDLTTEANRIDLELKNTPDDKDRLYIRSVIFLLQGEEIEAERLFDKITGIDDSYIQHINRAYFEVGQQLLNDPQKLHIGLHYLSKVEPGKLIKNEDLAAILLKAALSAHQRFDRLSRMLLEKAVILNPVLNHSDELFYFLYIKLSENADSTITAGKEFLTTFPNSRYTPDTLNILAERTYERGQFQESKKYVKHLAEKYQETEYGKRAKNKLAGWKEVLKKKLKVIPSSEPLDTGIEISHGKNLIIQASGRTTDGRNTQGPEGRNISVELQEQYILPHYPPMALIGKIGEKGIWFHIGKFVKHVNLLSSGKLYLSINHQNNTPPLNYYSGSYEVIVIAE